MFLCILKIKKLLIIWKSVCILHHLGACIFYEFIILNIENNYIKSRYFGEKHINQLYKLWHDKSDCSLCNSVRVANFSSRQEQRERERNSDGGETRTSLACLFSGWHFRAHLCWAGVCPPGHTVGFVFVNSSPDLRHAMHTFPTSFIHSICHSWLEWFLS